MENKCRANLNANTACLTAIFNLDECLYGFANLIRLKLIYMACLTLVNFVILLFKKVAQKFKKVAQLCLRKLHKSLTKLHKSITKFTEHKQRGFPKFHEHFSKV